MVCWLSLQKQANSLDLLWFVIVICRPSLDRALNPMDTAQLCAPRYRPIVQIQRYRILIPINIIGSGFQWINFIWTWIERVYNNNFISLILCVEIQINTAHGFDKLSTACYQFSFAENRCDIKIIADFWSCTLFIFRIADVKLNQASPIYS